MPRFWVSCLTRAGRHVHAVEVGVPVVEVVVALVALETTLLPSGHPVPAVTPLGMRVELRADDQVAGVIARGVPPSAATTKSWCTARVEVAGPVGPVVQALHEPRRRRPLGALAERTGISMGQGAGWGTNRDEPDPLAVRRPVQVDGAVASRVTWVGGPSRSIHRTKTCGPLGSPSAMYAIRVPSGDQTAEAPLAKNRFRPPSTSMIQSAESHRSSGLLIQRRV